MRSIRCVYRHERPTKLGHCSPDVTAIPPDGEARRFRYVLLALWILLVVLVVVPWGRFQDHAHWQRIAWVPFVSQPVRSGDIVRNIILYLPCGLLLVGRRRCARELWRVAVFAFALSVSTELTQVFSHGRFSSATDVTTNVFGALCGFVASRTVLSPPT